MTTLLQQTHCASNVTVSFTICIVVVVVVAFIIFSLVIIFIVALLLSASPPPHSYCSINFFKSNALPIAAFPPLDFFFFCWYRYVFFTADFVFVYGTQLHTHTHTVHKHTASHLFSQPVSHRVRQLLVCQCCGACKYATHKQAQHALVRVCRCVRSCVCLENYVKRKCIKWKCKWKCADAMCACVCVCNCGGWGNRKNYNVYCLLCCSVGVPYINTKINVYMCARSATTVQECQHLRAGVTLMGLQSYTLF